MPGKIAWGLSTMPSSRPASNCSLVKISDSRLLSASSYSLVMVSARVGQASMHSPHRMQRA